MSNRNTDSSHLALGVLTQMFQHIGRDFLRRHQIRTRFEEVHDTVLTLLNLPEYDCGHMDWKNLDLCLLWQDGIGITHRELMTYVRNLVFQ